jgi:putative serine protease PepD
MDSGGSFTFGEFPEDPGPGEHEGASTPRGWVPPEDRLWRHPSEIRPGSGSPRWAPFRSGRSHRTRTTPARWRVTSVLAGALVAALAVTGALYLTSSRAAPPTTATVTSLVSVGPDMAKAVEVVSPSLVTLLPAGHGGSGLATGVVLPAGNLIVTAAAAVAGGERMMVKTADGREMPGEVEGVDSQSGVAVVAVSRRLTPSSFVDEPVGAKQIAIAACRCSEASSGTANKQLASAVPAPEVAMGMIRQVGAPASDGGPALVDAIEVEVPLGPSAWGSVLLDDEGGVLGVLAAERSSRDDTVGYFVPAPLAVGVADELAQHHKVVRGWLGVVCQNYDGAGAQVTSVLPASPAAAAGLQPGDVLEAVDSKAVLSLTDLQARLYASPPGTQLVLTLLRGGAVDTTAVTVGAGPS